MTILGLSSLGSGMCCAWNSEPKLVLEISTSMYKARSDYISTKRDTKIRT